jgi:hypothetical protein
MIDTKRYLGFSIAFSLSASRLARAGLHNEDRLINVNDEDVTHRPHRGKQKAGERLIYALLSI